MNMEATLFDLAFTIVAFPFQLIKYVMYSVLNVVVFDILQLGPYLPLG